MYFKKSFDLLEKVELRRNEINQRPGKGHWRGTVVGIGIEKIVARSTHTINNLDTLKKKKEGEKYKNFIRDIVKRMQSSLEIKSQVR